jgi:hypothetical protein
LYGTFFLNIFFILKGKKKKRSVFWIPFVSFPSIGWFCSICAQILLFHSPEKLLTLLSLVTLGVFHDRKKKRKMKEEEEERENNRRLFALSEFGSALSAADAFISRQHPLAVASTAIRDVTSHIAWEWGCAYMYKCTLYDTTRFKAVMAMNLSELRS